MKKYKLAIFITHPIQYYSPFFYFLSKNFKECDITVYYFSDFSLYPYFDTESKSKVNWGDNKYLIEGYKNIILKNYGIDNQKGFFAYFNPSIIKNIKNEKFDLVICYGWASLSHWLVILSSIMFKTPFSFVGDSNILNDNIKGLKKIIKKKLLSLVFHKASACFYCGTQNKKFYQYYGVTNNKLFLIPFASDNEKIINSYNNINKKLFRSELNIPDDHIIITFAGRFVDRKNPHLMLKAINRLTHDKITILMIGDGETKEKLKAIASKMRYNVIFTGFLKQSDIIKHFSISDIFILPSYSEAWGLVVNEAMCCKNAIIASNNIGSAIDLVQNGKNGYIFKNNDINDLVNKIDLLVNSNIEKFKEKSFQIINSWGYQEGMNGIKKYFKSREVK